MACMFNFACCMNLLLAQLVKYDVHTTRKIKFIHAIFLSQIIIFSSKWRVTCQTDVKFCLLTYSLNGVQYGSRSSLSNLQRMFDRAQSRPFAQPRQRSSFPQSSQWPTSWLSWRWVNARFVRLDKRLPALAGREPERHSADGERWRWRHLAACRMHGAAAAWHHQCEHPGSDGACHWRSDPERRRFHRCHHCVGQGLLQLVCVYNVFHYDNNNYY